MTCKGNCEDCPFGCMPLDHGQAVEVSPEQLWAEAHGIGEWPEEVEVPAMLTLEEVELLAEIYERSVDDQVAIAAAADCGFNPHGLTLEDMATWAVLDDEFVEAVNSLALWGDLDPHEPDEPIADWELALIAEAFINPDKLN